MKQDSTRQKSQFNDLTGRRYGRLVVIGRAPNSTAKRPRTMFWCRCDCDGKTVSIQADALVHGITTSCGCFRAELLKTMNRTHGHSSGGKHSRTYSAFYNMWTRCTNPKSGDFPRYGARGITICDRWRSFEAFLADMGPCPPGLEIDRIDPNGNYEPSNCHWVTNREQARNRRSTRWHTLHGETFIQADWALKFGISRPKLSRLLGSGHTIEQVAAQVGYVPRKPPVSVGTEPAPLHKQAS